MQSAKQKSAKTSPKNKQNLIKRSPKTSNPQVLKKKPQIPEKASPNSRENRSLKVMITSGREHCSPSRENKQVDF